jgi:hypothetical protein
MHDKFEEFVVRSYVTKLKRYRHTKYLLDKDKQALDAYFDEHHDILKNHVEQINEELDKRAPFEDHKEEPIRFSRDEDGHWIMKQ